MELGDLYTEVVTEYSRSQKHRHPLENPDVTMRGVNPSCGDEIELFLKMKDGAIEDASYTGIGCAISQASVSIMIDLVRGKTPAEARELCRLFLNMIRRIPLSADVKCATMPWHTLETALDAVKE